jgi:hypothetical protein
MNIRSALRTDRMCASLTGLTVKEFNNLANDFSWNYHEYEVKRKPERRRKLGGGRRSYLRTAEEKLFYILFYMKTYPTFDVASFLVGFHRSKACEWVQTLLPILEQTLNRKMILPQRKISSVDEFIRLYPEVRDVFGDATERKVQRPKEPKRQRKMYSGKKKMHGRKNVVLADKNKRILVLTPTKSARRHDKRLADKQNLFQSIPESVAVWLDTGFQGVQKDHFNTFIPKKRTKNHQLTEEEKVHNSIISSFRVVAEHAICGMKRFNCLKHSYRNKKTNMDDQFALISAGLWNYHLQVGT